MAHGHNLCKIRNRQRNAEVQKISNFKCYSIHWLYFDEVGV